MPIAGKFGGYTVYGLIDPSTKLLRYVGQTINMCARKSAHSRPARKHDKSYAANWKRKLWPAVPELVILEECKNQEALDKAEIYFIAYFKALGANLTNHMCGGDGGLKHDSATREKMSKAKLGKKQAPRTQEHCDKISAALKGRKLSAEHVAKLVKHMTGKTYPNGYKCTKKIRKDNS